MPASQMYSGAFTSSLSRSVFLNPTLNCPKFSLFPRWAGLAWTLTHIFLSHLPLKEQESVSDPFNQHSEESLKQPSGHVGQNPTK